MDDTKKIKTLFSIETTSIVSDTADEKTGEASIGYNYALDTSLPELIYALAGFLKAIDTDDDIKATFSGTSPVGEAFIALLQQYYNSQD